MGHKKFRTVALGVSLLACMAAEQAAAQASAPAATADAAATTEGETIVVTGSRLARLRSDATVPTLVTPVSAIERSGDLILSETFKRNPAFSFTAPAASSPVGAQSAFSSGQTFIDYLGLGSQRTLVLIDSHRSVSSNSASVFGAGGRGSQVDLNTIPTLMIDRIETIAVGGAPIYGSDAIAGTVNLVLKDRFQGVKLDAQAGVSGQHDAPEYRLGVLAGTDFAGGRGSLVASFEWTRSEGLLASDRAVTANAPGYMPSADGRSMVYVPNLRTTAVSEYGIPLAVPFLPGFGYDIYNGQGQTLAFDATGQLAPFSLGSPSPAAPYITAGGSGYNPASVTSLLTPLERYVGYAKARYELTDGITAHLSASYARSQGTTLRTDPAYNGISLLYGAANDYLMIPLSNPFLSAADRATLANSLHGQPYFFLARANTDAVTGRSVSTTDLVRVNVSLEGDFALGGRQWHWDVSTSYGRSLTATTGRGLLEQNFRNALGSVFAAPCTGTSSPIAAINPTCSAFNPFGQTNSQATLDYVTAAYRARSENSQWVATASARGSLFDLPGGPASVALGFEHRYEHAEFEPDAYLYGQPGLTPTARRTSYGRNAPIDPVSGQFHTNEVFGELRLPLAEMVEVNAAGRWVDHSMTGGAFTWTTGARLRPLPGFALRGNFTHSIRSPAVTELFNPTSQAFLTGTDPCGASALGNGPNPAVRQANCAAAGVTAPLNANSFALTGVLGTFSGNSNLRNEVADSWTLGFVLTPRALPGLSLSVDWLDIKLKDAIVAETASQVLQACYDSTTYPRPAECSLFTRDATSHQITAIQTGYANASSQRYSGLSADLAWRWAAPFLGADGRITLDATYQYTDRLETRLRDTAITHLAGSIGYSKHKATGTLALDNKAVGGWVRVNYTGPAVLDMDVASTFYDTPHRDGVAFVDAGARFTVEDRFTLRLSVDNVFDTKPPFPAPAGGGVIAYWQGVMGRYFKVGASAAF